jgi:hypothetical protein
VSAAKQREALKFLQEHVFSDKAVQVPPELLRRLAAERWDHWGTDAGANDFPLHDRILGIQRVALNHLLNPAVLRRIQSNLLKAEGEAQPLTMAEVLRGVTDGIWSDLPNGTPQDEKQALSSSIVRRNLQREYLKKLSSLVLGQKTFDSGFIVFIGDRAGAAPADARSLARLHLREINNRIQAALDKAGGVDETTRAHLDECRERIAKVLTASVQVND